jgi:protein-tyrosine phosphatase
MTSSSALREPEGIHNFRSLAGYPIRGGGRIREGMIYRAGALEMMTEADRAYLADELALRERPHWLADRVVELSIFPDTVNQDALIAELNGLYGPGPSPHRYLHYLQVGGERLARAFELFAAESTYPILVHCTAGKDRTGVLLGMLMDVLGCDEADIAAEYGLSDASIDRLLAYLRASGRQLEGSDDEIRARLATPPDRMAGFVQLLREHHGGGEAFFLSQGIDPALIARVRELLVEPEE